METGKLKLALSAGALALSMALAGCGGSSSGGGAQNPGDDDSEAVVTPMVDCGGGVMAATSAGCAAALEAANQAAETAFEKAGGTPGALLIASGANAGTLNVSALDTTNNPGRLGTESTADFMKLKPTDKIEGLNGSENPGMTWFQALGAEKVSLTIGDTDPVEGEGYALKVTGEATTDFEFETVSPPAAGSSSTKGAVLGEDDGSQVEYMGIPGVLICNGDSCSANAADQLTGDWVFQARHTTAADADTRLWVKKGKEYALRSTQPHADWGVWLTDADSNGPGMEIQWYVRGFTSGDDRNLSVVTVDGLADTATYKGSAVGVSTLSKTEDKDATVGSFTADAELKATFGATAGASTLEGTISKFVGRAVNPDWELTLQKSLLGDATGNLAALNTSNTNRATKVGTVSISDTWNAQLYGEAGSRPSGVVGEFDGRFDDGQAIGVFHAK